jgi:hypothetical protein
VQDLFILQVNIQIQGQLSASHGNAELPSWYFDIYTAKCVAVLDPVLPFALLVTRRESADSYRY